jgi:hypothetical protein
MPEAPSQFFKSERKWIWLLCGLAIIHVLIFAAAFPFFNNVDEQQHFDLAVKYSEGHVPRAMEPPSAEICDYVAVYNTFEYLSASNDFPPPWTQPMDKVAPMLASRAAAWSKTVNYESSQPPLYYIYAGAWWRIGKIFGLHDAVLLYLLRFANVFVVATLVWLGYWTAKLIFPEIFFIRMAVPALIAFMPQSSFYSIQNDIFSPLCFGLTFILIIKFLRAENFNARFGASVGLAIAATLLTKMSNAPLLAVSGIFIARKIFRLITANRRDRMPGVLTLVACAGVPVSLWLVWCKIHFGDWTGSVVKAQLLGWTLKPVSEWFHHPIFSLDGIWIYLSGQLSTFWQGEMWWHHQPLSLEPANLFYTMLSIAFVVVTMFKLLRGSKTAVPRHALWFALICCIAELAFFAFLSVIYDFHDCQNPSREHPYFHAGRMMLGALIPFLLLFVYGLDQLLNRFGNKIKFAALGLLLAAMITFEIVTDWPVFFSQYNWYHL